MRPLLIIFLGIASTHTESYVQNSCKDAWAAGYQPVVVLQRGFDNRTMDHYQTISFAEWKIVYEAVNQLHASYCRESGRKLFILTYSLSGNWAALALALKDMELKSKVAAAVLM